MAPKTFAAQATTIAFCFVLVAVAGAQNPPPFRTGVEVVSLDATVVDKTGKPISDLTPKDFQVTVDGKERRVVTAQFINHLNSAPPAPAASPNSAAADPGAPAPAPPVAGRNVLVLFDEDSILTGDGLQARKAAAALLDGLSPLDRVGVNFIPRLRSKFNLTTDRAENRTALNAWVPGEYREPLQLHRISLREATEIARGDGITLNEVFLRECRPDERTCKQDLVDESRVIAKRSGARGTLTLDTLKILAQDFRAIPGPKTMILISSGSRKPEDSASFEQMAKEFAASEVSLYTIFLEKGEYNIARGRPSPSQNEDDQMEKRELANTTSVVGGTFLDVVGTIEPVFQRIALELSGEYLLGIEAAPADRDGRPHKVTIKVNRKDVDVRGRKQYVIPAIK